MYTMSGVFPTRQERHKDKLSIVLYTMSWQYTVQNSNSVSAYAQNYQPSENSLYMYYWQFWI